MTDKAYKVIAKALEQFENKEFDSVAVVMLSKKGTAYFDSATVSRLEMGSLLRIMEADMLEPIRRRMRTRDEEAEREEAK